MTAFSILFSTVVGGTAAMVLSGGVLAQAAQPGPNGTAAAPPATVSALPDQRQSARLFDRLDRNRDGYLNTAELENRQGDWIAVDRDGDGRISRSEFQALR
jgi:hypothetical protein